MKRFSLNFISHAVDEPRGSAWIESGMETIEYVYLGLQLRV